MDEKILNAKRLLDVLYNTDDGGVGGYGHIVFDDGNIEDENIDWCLMNAEKSKHANDLSEETRVASINALKAFKLITESERELVLSFER